MTLLYALIAINMVLSCIISWNVYQLNKRMEGKV